ncbi:MAG: hypothetical protein GXO29_03315 [Thermotogae bacterium]|nr:hypothetical protein [Thermotogota bacterium]
MNLPGDFLTLLPPPVVWDEGRVREYVGEAEALVSNLGGDVAVNVPEVVRLSRRPRPFPFTEKMDLLEFGRLLKGRGLDVYLDRHFPLLPKEKTLRWMEEAKTVADGVVVVGRILSDYPYPGYDVEEAISLARRIFPHVGAITIINRPNEEVRACSKVRAGADFLISQITFMPEEVERFVIKLKGACGGSFPRLYVSVAPVFGEEELQLLRWMEVPIPRRIPPLKALAERMREIPGVAGINYEHLRYSNVGRLLGGP